ncbi:hypothetical protein SASPL_140354 [Salvia splendens]|uniref:Uncharacterized protein n=1 Tax=Salvia splendens TaxID=180675 RepID=A0A8X8WRH3_SALSN|nr:hypothetical protein SASPL_140354 [Salvia splendens]
MIARQFSQLGGVTIQTPSKITAHRWRHCHHPWRGGQAAIVPGGRLDPAAGVAYAYSGPKNNSAALISSAIMLVASLFLSLEISMVASSKNLRFM